MTKSVFSFKRSKEWQEFSTWCDLNGKLPMPLLKQYLTYTVLLNQDLTFHCMKIDDGFGAR